jgi:hypothetical protein
VLAATLPALTKGRAMALAYLFGSLLLGVGPGVVVYCFYLLRKPLLVLLSLARWGALPSPASHCAV